MSDVESVSSLESSQEETCIPTKSGVESPVMKKSESIIVGAKKEETCSSESEAEEVPIVVVKKNRKRKSPEGVAAEKVVYNQKKEIFGTIVNSGIKELLLNEMVAMDQWRQEICFVMKSYPKQMGRWIRNFIEEYEEVWDTTTNKSICLLSWNLLKKTFLSSDESLSTPSLTPAEVKDMVKCMKSCLKSCQDGTCSSPSIMNKAKGVTGISSTIVDGGTTPVSALFSMFGRELGGDANLPQHQTPAHLLSPYSSIVFRGAVNSTSVKSENVTGSHLIEMKVYKCSDIVGVPFMERWKKSLITAKIVANEVDPLFQGALNLLQKHKKFMESNGAREKSFPTNYQNSF